MRDYQAIDDTTLEATIDKAIRVARTEIAKDVDNAGDAFWEDGRERAKLVDIARVGLQEWKDDTASPVRRAMASASVAQMVGKLGASTYIRVIREGTGSSRASMVRDVEAIETVFTRYAAHVISGQGKV